MIQEGWYAVKWRNQTKPNVYSKVKLATVVKGDQNATTQQYRGGQYSFPLIAALYPWHLPYIAEC